MGRRAGVAAGLTLTVLVALLGWVVLTGPRTGVRPEPAPLAGTAEVSPAAVDAFVERQRERHRLPGIGLTLIEEGRVTYSRGYGDAADDRPMTAATPVAVGSISETFTAILVLQLVEAGRVDLDQPLAAYLPEEEGPTASATVRDLLNRAGHPPDVGVATVVADRGYAGLVRLVERLTGQSYAEALRTRILSPLGMDDTTAARENAAVAQGHIKVFGFPMPVDAPGRLGVRTGADVVSTTDDLAELALTLGLGTGSEVLGERGVALVRDPDQRGTDGYGMGWELARHREVEAVSGHRGVAPTYFTQMWVLPDHRSGYVLTVTSDHLLDRMVAMPQLREGLLDLLTGRQPPTDGPAMRTVGLVMLAMLLVSLALQVWSFLGLRHWRRRSRHMSRMQLVRHVGPHLVFPVIVLILTWPLVPQLAGGRIADVPSVAAYLFPDVLLLVMLAVLPDLAKAAYMTVTAVRGRRPRRPRWARLA